MSRLQLPEQRKRIECQSRPVLHAGWSPATEVPGGLLRLLVPAYTEANKAG